MHTAVETRAFSSWIASYPVSVYDAVLDDVMGRPDEGALLKETGGIRKRRVYIHGAQKWSLRIFTYYMNKDTPVYLLAGLNKNEGENLTKAERNLLAKFVAEWKVEWRGRHSNPDGGTTIMPSLLFTRLMAGLQDAKAHSLGELPLPTHEPIKALRLRRGLTQAEAAEMLRVPVATYRNWEQGRSRTPGPVRKLMEQS